MSKPDDEGDCFFCIFICAFLLALLFIIIESSLANSWYIIPIISYSHDVQNTICKNVTISEQLSTLCEYTDLYTLHFEEHDDFHFEIIVRNDTFGIINEKNVSFDDNIIEEIEEIGDIDGLLKNESCEFYIVRKEIKC